MIDPQNLTNVSAVKINRMIEAIMNAMGEEDRMVVVIALAGVLGNMANGFTEPQAILDYAFEIANQTLKDTSTLHHLQAGKSIN